MTDATPEKGLVERFPALARLGFGGRKRIPYVQQTTAADCGAACLTMILAYHGKRLRLDEVRDITGFGRDGADALALVRAGRWFGLRGRGMRVERIEDLELVPRGSILHWRFRHFLVFERLGPNGLEVIDPAGGRRTIPRQEAERDFTGVALAFEPSEDFEPGDDSGPKTAWQYLKKFLTHSGLLSRLLVTSILVQIFALAVPFLIGILVDRVVPRGDYHLLLVLSVGLLAIVVFNFLASLVRAHLLLHLRTQLDAQFTLDFLDHLVELPYSFFQRRSSGDLMMRLNSNATVREILTSGALSTLLDGVLVSLYLVMLFVASWKMALLVLVLAVLRVGIFLLTRRKHRELMSRSLHSQAESQSYQVQMLSGIETLKASGAEHRAVEHWSNLFVDVLNVSLDRGRLSAWTDSLLEGLATASPVVILLWGATLVLQGELSLGVMLAVNALASGFLRPLSELVQTAFQLQILGSYLDRINDVLETPKEQESKSVRRAPPLRGEVSLDNVSFSYGPNEPLVVQEVSLAIEPGSFVALVGRSGAGKTTLAGLLLGLYLPTEGAIAFDDIPLGELDLRTVRSQMGIVPQQPYLFGLSIRANIALADPTMPLARVVEAARRAHIHDEILAMPMGYETQLGEGGSSLSGGQRQRIALARALVQRPAILLLDEATSNLDAITEARIHRELDELACTRIVIAHRLSTIRNADEILVMEGGRLVEGGSHQELMQRDGLYRELVEQQIEREQQAEAG